MPPSTEDGLPRQMELCMAYPATYKAKKRISVPFSTQGKIQVPIWNAAIPPKSGACGLLLTLGIRVNFYERRFVPKMQHPCTSLHHTGHI
jgi:hypothetical protein